MKEITSNFGVEYDEKSKELFIKTDHQYFANSKSRLLQAVMRIGDLSVLTKTNVKSVFIDDISDLLREQNVIFTPI
ncbi:DUF1828 domain-containing protein [Liquorilactobacillus vini]|uniref:DUF1828 domain-containing protein n=1 Tax=Liquorilactobacillus vini TaxID=238015 RepID=UPI00399D5E7B